MTSISSAYAHQSPLTRLQTTLQSEISTGSIQSTDEDALTSALQSIDESLESERSSSTSNSRPPSPDEMNEKIANLIQDQVEAGTLTEEQATELASVFDEAFAKGAGGPQGAGGPPPGGAGGPPPGSGGPPEEAAAASDSDTSSSSSIADILKQLQDAISESSQTSYSASGSAGSSSVTSYLFDLIA